MVFGPLGRLSLATPAAPAKLPACTRAKHIPWPTGASILIEPVPLQLTLFSLLKPPEVSLSTDTKIHRVVRVACMVVICPPYTPRGKLSVTANALLVVRGRPVVSIKSAHSNFTAFRVFTPFSHRFRPRNPSRPIHTPSAGGGDRCGPPNGSSIAGERRRALPRPGRPENDGKSTKNQRFSLGLQSGARASRPGSREGNQR